MDTNFTQEEDLMEGLSFDSFRQTVLDDYKLVCVSRETSLLARKEVLTGKAKFGIFGGGKEVAQVAMAKFFMPGDFRSGYYRDQTFMFAAQLATVEQFFAQLYADPDVAHDPFSAGRQMNAHFSTPFVDKEGNWLPLTDLKNVSADSSPTGGQMPRALGLAFASKVFRELGPPEGMEDLSNDGNEICFCTIGDSSTSEGHFWETMNAAGVMQIPLAVFVWDDGYGISVPKEYQTIKSSISSAMSGFQQKDDTNGINIYRLKGWDYAGMCEILEPALEHVRETHTPALFHIQELTQPQGHSTSGSHERYKSPERLAWEKQWDCKKQMRDWILENTLAGEEELDHLEKEAKHDVKEARNAAWKKYITPIKEELDKAVSIINQYKESAPNKAFAASLIKDLTVLREPGRKNVMKSLSALINHPETDSRLAAKLTEYHQQLLQNGRTLYDTFLYNEGPKSALKVPPEEAKYAKDAPTVNGFEVLNKYFDILFQTNSKVLAFGEDVGNIGDVNQGFSGLQKKHGKSRIFDSGIREASIMGQGIGLALRGFKPIAEIQYLDYIFFGLQPLADDASSTHYRTFGQQSVPLIVRTRGHRLEGIWHSGSPMGMLINSLRGMYVCVPRDMTRAVGMYNTLLESNDPGIVIECLNGYRLKEKLPGNLQTFRVALGVPEVIRQGEDITIVSYGSVLRNVDKAAKALEKLDISCEIIDVQTLLPFDIHHLILESLKKTSRILFVDEDVPGGASAYMYQKVMEEQNGYRWLDVAPRTLTSKAHRPAYGTDGDYFSKPNTEAIIAIVRRMMKE